MKYIKGLNTIRAFAVLFVLKEHFGVWFDDTTTSGALIKQVFMPGGRFGVNLFYTLSGFLITSILLKAKNSNTGSRTTVVKNFFIRRALRIFPIYYLLLFTLYFINYPDIHEYFAWFATYTTNILVYKTGKWNSFSHVWTLAIEEQFYLFWPWLMIFVSNKYIKYILFASVAVGVVTTFITMQYYGHGAGFLVYNALDAFGIGGLYAWARLDDKRNARFITIIKILVVPALFTYFFWLFSFVYGYAAPYQALFKTVDSIIAIWIIMLVVNNRSARLNKYFLENRLLNYIGKISYGIYLYHIVYIVYLYPRLTSLVQQLSVSHPQLAKPLQDRHINYWIHIALMIGIAAVSFELIETPLLRLKDYFNYNGKKGKTPNATLHS